MTGKSPRNNDPIDINSRRQRATAETPGRGNLDTDHIAAKALEIATALLTLSGAYDVPESTPENLTLITRRQNAITAAMEANPLPWRIVYTESDPA